MRIVIAEDHLLFRDLFRKICTTELGCTLVGEADTGRAAILTIRSTLPDLVLLDLHLPDGDGFEVAAHTLAHWPDIRVLLLSSHCDDYTLFQVERSGAHGFIDKNTQTVSALGEAISALRRGETYFSPAFLEAKTARVRNSTYFMKILSDRECIILSLIGHSMSDHEIAVRLCISHTTAQTHRSHIMRKLEIPSTAKLVQFAIEHGFTRVITQRNGTPVLS